MSDNLTGAGVVKFLTVTSMVAMAATGALAQKPVSDDRLMEELIVTATKRQQSIQDVPMSVTAFGEAVLERNAITSLEDYGVRIPNLTYGAGGESRADNQLAIAIRGVVGKGTTGFYIDETPLLGSVNPQVLELERIEVLRGPQGTLYGARSMGGTVRFITKQPNLDEFEGRVHGEVSDTAHGDMNYKLDGRLNIPVVEGKVAVRVLGYSFHEAGFLDRVALPNSPVPFQENKNFNDSRTYGGQVSTRISALDGKLTITPRFAFEDTERGGRSHADVVADNYVNRRLFDISEENGANWQLGTLTLEYDMPIGSLVSSSSYFDRFAYDNEDGSEILNLIFTTPGQEVPVFIAATDYDEVFSQEIRFASDFDGPLQFTVGAFYQDSTAAVEFLPTSMEGVAAEVFTLDQTTKVEEIAAFIEVTYDITNRLRVIAGARIFENKVDFASITGGFVGDSTLYTGIQKENDINPKIGIQYDIDDDRMAYVTAAKGFRIGGVNPFNATACAAGIADLGLTADQLKGYESDSLWNYEAGLRSSWLDRRLRVNAAVFFVDWKNLQQRIGLGSCGFYADTNMGSAENKGFEVEVDWALTNEFSAFFGAGYTDAEITDDGGFEDAVKVGQPVQNVPQWTFNTGFDYDFEVSGLPMFLHGDLSYVDKSYNGRNSGTILRLRPSYTIANIRAGVEVGDMQIVAFVSNVTNERANLQDVPPMVIEYPDRPRIAVNRPRTIGLEFRTDF